MREKEKSASRPLGIGKGGGTEGRFIRPGDLEPAIEANLYHCLAAGGHLVDRNPCPIHHQPTTRYGE
jgi:hypothetical protein